MSSRRQQKDKRKVEQAAATIEDRVTAMEQFLAGLFGAVPEVQNVQYLVGKSRTYEMQAAMLANEGNVFRQYIKENDLGKNFLEWQDKKKLEFEAQQKAAMEKAKQARLKQLETEPGCDGACAPEECVCPAPKDGAPPN